MNSSINTPFSGSLPLALFPSPRHEEGNSIDESPINSPKKDTISPLLEDSTENLPIVENLPIDDVTDRGCACKTC